MPQARGIDTSVVLIDESTYGATPGSPSGTLLYLTKFGVKSAQNRIDSETLSGQRARLKPAFGNLNVAGSLEMEIGAESIGPLLKHALGVDTPSGMGPYVHVLSIGDLPVGFVLDKDHGSNISGSGRFEEFNGSRISKMDLDFPSEGYCKASFDVIGADSTLASAALDSTPTDNGHTSFSSFEGAIEEGGSPIATVTAAKISLNNDLDESIFAIGGQGVRRALPEGFATVTGQITTLFEDPALLAKAIAGTESDLKITLSRGTGLGSAGNESIEFFVQQLVYERTSPDINGPKGVLAQFNFKAFRVAADAGLLITLKNAVATL